MTNAAGFPDYAIIGNGVTIPFNSAEPDVNGCYWYLDGEIGGWDSPDGRVSMLTKIGTGPAANGEYPADQHYRGRTLSFKLSGICPSIDAREDAWSLLAQACDLVDNTGLFMANETIPKQCVVSRAGNNTQGKLTIVNKGLASAGSVISEGFALPTIDAKGSIYPLEADIELYCTDPYKYAQEGTVATIAGGTAAIENIGNTDSAQLVIDITAGINGITGPLTLTIASLGMELVVPTLPAAAPPPNNFPGELILDCYNKLITGVTIFGDLNYYYLRNLQTPWLYLPAGDSSLVVSGGPDIDGSTVTYSSAWV